MGEPQDNDRALTKLHLLENRRLAIDQSTWQGPTLTLVVQAFLLGVLTDDGVGWAVASAVAAAGISASLVSMLALWLLHDREAHYGERVKELAATLELDDLNRTNNTGRLFLDWKGWRVWELVLFVFLVADVVALIVTRT
jgi:hypothetical protein